MRPLFLLFAFLMLAGGANAWLEDTNRYICEKAVEEVWGRPVVDNCLPRKSSKFLNEMCREVYDIKGSEIYGLCVNAINSQEFIHPVNWPTQIFDDTELHHDYSKGCPIHAGPAKNFLCGAKDDMPAYYESEKWFNKSEKATDICMRVYDFCIGAFYYAESENPLNQMTGYEESQCSGPLEKMVNERILAGDADWMVHRKCNFGTMDYEEDIWVRDERITSIIGGLVERGRIISEKPLKDAKKVVILSNSIDLELAFPFYNYLMTRDITVVHSTADDFAQYQYEKFIIMLGGQNAPEGTGDIVRTIITSDERSYLVEGEGRKIMSVKENEWTQGQRVIVLAGYDKFDTQNASIEHQEEIYHLILAT